MPSIPDLIHPLCDDGVAVRFAAERDIPEILIAYQDDPQLHLKLGFERPPSGAELGRAVESAEDERAAGTAARLTLVRLGSAEGAGELGSAECAGELGSAEGAGELGSAEFAGQIDLQAIDWDHSSAEVGIWLIPAMRGRGLGWRSLRLVARWALTACGLQRVGVFTEPGNRAMTAAARAAGFTSEGVLRGYLRERGQRVDRAVFSLIKSDLPAT